MHFIWESIEGVSKGKDKARVLIELSVGKAAAQDAGLSEEKRLTKWVCKVFKELGLNKIENSEN